MLSQGDAALCARDTALPGLAAVLDAGTLALKAGLGAVRVNYLRYKPGTSCVAGLIPTDGGLGAFAAMTYPPDRYAEVRARYEWHSGPDPAHFFDEICTVLAPLSLDRKLKAARALGSVDRRNRFVEKLGLGGATLSLLRYKPGRRLVLRAVTPSGDVALIKSHGPRDFHNATQGARHVDDLLGVRLIAISEGKRSIAARWVDGETLDPTRAGHEALCATGRELARLHLAAPRSDAGAWRSDPRTAVKAVAALLPDLAGPAASAATRIIEALGQLDPRSCILHGDFSADQVVLHKGQPVIIDWDRIAVGNPARDLGSFLARLDADVIEGVDRTEHARATEASFLEGYASGAGHLPSGIEIHRAAAVLALAPQAFRTRQPNWPNEIKALIARAETLVPRDRAPRVLDTRGLADALAVRVIAPKLSAALGTQAACKTANLLRHKQGRRALIRYELAGGEPILGKLRAKGPDRRTPKVHRALRDAGLDGRGPHHVGVPDPLGEIDAPPVWLQRLVPGQVLTGLIDAGDAARQTRHTGRALAMLHEANVACDRSWSMTDEFDVLDRALSDAAVARPDLQVDIEAIRVAVSKLMSTLPAIEETGIHRDFYPDQVLIDGQAVWLVDLDLFARGDPVLDLGNFIAHLTELGLRHYSDAERHRAESEAFLAGYGDVRGEVGRDHLAVLHWISLVRHIGISGRIDGRRHTTGSLVSICATGPSAALFRSNRPPRRSPAA